MSFVVFAKLIQTGLWSIQVDQHPTGTIQLISTQTSYKCFTYDTKTIANLITYSRKPGDYNGTIIFETDIVKKVLPNQFQSLSNLTF